MNPRMIIMLILAVPIVAPAFLEKRFKVSTFHTVVGMGLCLVEAMTLFLVGGWDFLTSGYEKKSYFLFMCVLAVAAFIIGGINLRVGARIKERHEEIVRNGGGCNRCATMIKPARSDRRLFQPIKRNGNAIRLAETSPSGFGTDWRPPRMTRPYRLPERSPT